MTFFFLPITTLLSVRFPFYKSRSQKASNAGNDVLRRETVYSFNHAVPNGTRAFGFKKYSSGAGKQSQTSHFL